MFRVGKEDAGSELLVRLRHHLQVMIESDPCASLRGSWQGSVELADKVLAGMCNIR